MGLRDWFTESIVWFIDDRIFGAHFIMYYKHGQFALEEEKLKRNTSRKRTLMKRVEDIDKEISTKNNNSYC